MSSKIPIIAGGGRKFGGRPLTWLFSLLSFFGFSTAFVSWEFLYPSDSESSISSGWLWLCSLLSLLELVFIVLAIRFAIVEKPTGNSGEPYDPRKLY